MSLTSLFRSSIHLVLMEHCRSFDQARLIRHNRILAMNGIDPSGKNICISEYIAHDLIVLFKACPWIQRQSLVCRSYNLFGFGSKRRVIFCVECFSIISDLGIGVY